jgi:coenzyme F420-reducing hydrogenase beta subunit
LGNYSAFRSALNKISGAKNVQVKEMKADKYTLIVEYPNGAKQLADALMLKPFDGFSVTIQDVTQNQMRVILVHGQQ